MNRRELPRLGREATLRLPDKAGNAAQQLEDDAGGHVVLGRSNQVDTPDLRARGGGTRLEAPKAPSRPAQGDDFGPIGDAGST